MYPNDPCVWRVGASANVLLGKCEAGYVCILIELPIDNGTMVNIATGFDMMIEEMVLDEIISLWRKLWNSKEPLVPYIHREDVTRDENARSAYPVLAGFYGFLLRSRCISRWNPSRRHSHNHYMEAFK
jgi:hypothetical protein